MLGAQMGAFIVDFGNLTFKFKRIEYWPIQWTVGQDYRGWSPADGIAFLLAKWIQLYFHLQWGCMNISMGFKEHLNMTSVLSSHFSPALSGWPSCSRFGWKLLLLDFSVKILIFSGLLVLCTFSWELQTDLIPRQPKHPGCVNISCEVIGGICDRWRTWKKTRAAPSSGWTVITLCG